jgi:acetylornithine/succinyldiaminopimelate/putrescine aminotransferase
MKIHHPLAETYGQILREQLPNLFRLYLNPYVTETCFCLERYIQTTWNERETCGFQSFLANSFDEALSGAIKLARYCASVADRTTWGLVVDVADRLGPFVGASAAGGRVEFVPGLAMARANSGDLRALAESTERFGFLLLASTANDAAEADALRRLLSRDRPLVITCLDHAGLADLRRVAGGSRSLPPDIVIFDESFVNHDVPFSAFSARQGLYDHWNRPGKATFHSTTFQPNTISALHFMNCLKEADPEFLANAAAELQRIHRDIERRGNLFRRLYSPSLQSAIRRTGCWTPNVRAAGDFVVVDDVQILDAVSGVACSVRGHNPPAYAEEIESQGDLTDCKHELQSRLENLTGLECVLPAVSGASAVETALKLALVAQFPRRHVLALKAGFGGKTLLALTGTWNESYKQHIDPLYPDVLYIDPFATAATAQLEAALARHPVAVVQVELVQAVGGVRRVPDELIRFLATRREQYGYLLLVDEVQTGMYRTGPFTMSRALGLAPDLLTLGKGTSDMMFPFALVLYSAAIRTRLEQAGSDLEGALRTRHSYELGYRTALNVLRRAEELNLSERVAEASALCGRLLQEGLAGCKAVREVRIFGMLIGIELETTRWPQRWLRKRLFWFYLFNMLRHPRFPLLVGFCQCEPNVLKITPSLTVAPSLIRDMCATIIDVLRRPFSRLLAAVLGGLIRPPATRRRTYEHADNRKHEPANVPADELVAR